MCHVRGFNLNSPSLKNNVCSKKFPKIIITETQIINNRYISYKRRSPDGVGFLGMVGQNTADNRRIVPYCRLFSNTFKARINFEFCNSVKTIKYFCKYKKGSDAVMFGSQQENSRDDVTDYQMCRYICSNETFGRIFGLPLHQRHSVFLQLLYI